MQLSHIAKGWYNYINATPYIKDLRRRNLPSPNKADALALTYYFEEILDMRKKKKKDRWDFDDVDAREKALGILYEKVQLTKELKRQMMIRQLLDRGIREYDGRSVYDLDYYTLRHVLAMQKLKF